MAADGHGERTSTFIGTLLSVRQESPQINLRDAVNFAKQLNRTFNVCSSRNVQLCKNGILNYILPSKTRTAALCDYLVDRALASAPRPADSRTTTSDAQPEDIEGLKVVDSHVSPPRSALKRLHMIYVAHDVLLTLHRWDNMRSRPSHLQDADLDIAKVQLRRVLLRLGQIAACCGEYRADEVGDQLSKLVARWDELQIIGHEELDRLRQTISHIPDRTWNRVLEEAAIEDEKKVVEQKKLQEEATKWIVPPTHGVKDNPDAPWNELPAANGLYMKSTRGYPLRAAAFPRGGFATEHSGEVAPPDLRGEVTWLHKELLRCFENSTDSSEIQDIDALGNKIWKDADRPTRNYWGFTYDKISQIKDNSKNFKDKAVGYDDVVPSALDHSSMQDVDAAVYRAKMLAGGRGGSDRGGMRSRGRAGGWRGPPRGGGSGFRGGRGGAAPGRYQ